MPELISCTVLPQGNLTSWHQNSLTNYHIIVKIMNKSWNYSIYDTCIMCFLNLFHRYSIIIAIVSLTFCCPNYSEHTITQSKYKKERRKYFDNSSWSAARVLILPCKCNYPRGDSCLVRCCTSVQFSIEYILDDKFCLGKRYSCRGGKGILTPKIAGLTVFHVLSYSLSPFFSVLRLRCSERQ